MGQMMMMVVIVPDDRGGCDRCMWHRKLHVPEHEHEAWVSVPDLAELRHPMIKHGMSLVQCCSELVPVTGASPGPGRMQA